MYYFMVAMLNVLLYRRHVEFIAFTTTTLRIFSILNNGFITFTPNYTIIEVIKKVTRFTNCHQRLFQVMPKLITTRRNKLNCNKYVE